MLYIDFNVSENMILDNPADRYDAYYDPKWFDDPAIVGIAESVDGVKHLFGDVFEHDLFGRCDGMKLSGGVKVLTLAYLGNTGGYVLPLSWLSENCFSVLGDLKIKSDVVFDGDYVPDLDAWECEFISKKTGNTVFNYDTFIKEYYNYVLRNNNS